MKWLENLMLYNDTKKTGDCPKCKSKNIEVTEHTHGNRKSLTFLCKECGDFAHFD